MSDKEKIELLRNAVEELLVGKRAYAKEIGEDKRYVDLECAEYEELLKKTKPEGGK